MASRGISHRTWQLDAKDFTDDYGNDTGFRQAVATELAQLEHMGERFGVGFVVAPIRKKAPGGSWYTAGWIFQSATVPAATQAPVPEPDDDPMLSRLGVDDEDLEPDASTIPGDVLSAATLSED